MATNREASRRSRSETADLKKNMRRYCIETAGGDNIGWYNVRTTTFQWTRNTIETFAKIERDEDLDQVAAWASIE